MSRYDIGAYGSMIGDGPRFAAYQDALRQTIRPESVVLDIGTGTGIHALIAAQLGARRVYALEVGDIIQVARDVARANGLEDRITFIQEISSRATLPERADLIVSDMRGILPQYSDHIHSIVDARRRFLADGGTLIPQRDTLYAAPVCAPDIYQRITAPWTDNDTGLDMSAALRLATQLPHRVRDEQEQLLAPAREWMSLDYSTIEDADCKGTIRWTAERTGTLHGFSVWFDTTLVNGVGFSNAPGSPQLIYGRSLFPLPHPVSVSANDTIHVELEARLLGGDYVWRWNSRVVRFEPPESDVNGGAGSDVHFTQSTFHGVPLTSRSLQLAETNYAPALSADGNIDREVLEAIDGNTTLREIARRIATRYPDAFPTPAAAVDRVAMLSRRYAK